MARREVVVMVAFCAQSGKGWTGPRSQIPAGYVEQPSLFPMLVPEGANLRGLKDGTRLTPEEMFVVVGWPDYPDEWSVLPLDDGGFVLRWADSMTTEELERSSAWHATEAAELKARIYAAGRA